MIDLITLALLVWAVIKGLYRGLVLAVFSLAAFIIGIAAALKLSAVTAGWLGESVNISAKWLPLVSFILVFIAVSLLINAAGKMLESTIEWTSLGWLNKAGGIVFYCILHLLVWSVVLFYLEKMHILSPESMEQSNTYPIIASWGPVTMEWLGKIIPVFSDVFEQLGHFFERISDDLRQNDK